MIKLSIFALSASILVGLVACSSSSSTPADASKPGVDGGNPPVLEDAGGAASDAGGASEDAGGASEDAGAIAVDAGGGADAASSGDAGSSASDAGGGGEDAGGEDAGSEDAGNTTLYCCVGATPIASYKAECALPDGGPDIFYSSMDGGVPCPVGTLCTTASAADRSAIAARARSSAPRSSLATAPAAPRARARGACAAPRPTGASPDGAPCKRGHPSPCTPA